MATSLLDWIMDLMRSGDAREAFETNPQAAMASAGFTNICGEDIADSRAFLFDNPSIKEVKGVDRPEGGGGDAPDQIRYIVNNYTFEAPESAALPEVEIDNENELENEIVDEVGEPGEPGEPGVDGPGDVEQNENEDSTVSNESTEAETDSVIEAGVGNLVTGPVTAGEDVVQDSTANESTNTLGDGVITLNDTLDMGNVEVLSHIVEDNLNNSLNESLNESLNDSLNIANDTLGDLVSLV